MFFEINPLGRVQCHPKNMENGALVEEIKSSFAIII